MKKTKLTALLIVAVTIVSLGSSLATAGLETDSCDFNFNALGLIDQEGFSKSPYVQLGHKYSRSNPERSVHYLISVISDEKVAPDVYIDACTVMFRLLTSCVNRTQDKTEQLKFLLMRGIVADLGYLKLVPAHNRNQSVNDDFSGLATLAYLSALSLDEKNKNLISGQEEVYALWKKNDVTRKDIEKRVKSAKEICAWTDEWVKSIYEKNQRDREIHTIEQQIKKAAARDDFDGVAMFVKKWEKLLNKGLEVGEIDELSLYDDCVSVSCEDE